MTQEIKIEKGVALPPFPRGAVRQKERLSYPFDEMRLGDSFLVDAEGLEFRKHWDTIRKSIVGQRVRLNRYFTMRYEPSDAVGKGGIRVWKIAKPRGKHRISG